MSDPLFSPVSKDAAKSDFTTGDLHKAQSTYYAETYPDLFNYPGGVEGSLHVVYASQGSQPNYHGAEVQRLFVPNFLGSLTPDQANNPFQGITNPEYGDSTNPIGATLVVKNGP